VNKKQVFFVGALHFWSDIYALFFPVYMAIAGLDPVRSAAIAGVSSLIANALQPLLGYWSDRQRGKLPVFLGLLLGALPLSMIGLTRSYGLLFLLVLLGRLGISMFHPGATNIAGAAGRHRGELSFSIFLTLGVVGMAFSQPYFSLVTARLGNSASVLLAVPAVAVACVYLLSGRMAIYGPPQTLDLRAAWRVLRLRAGPIGLLLLIMVFRQGFITAIGFFSAQMFADWGFSRLSYSSANTFFNLAGGAGILLSGAAAHRFRPRGVILFSLLAFLPFFGLLLVSGSSRSLWLAFAGLGVCGFILNLSQVQNVMLGHRLLPEITSTVSGILMGLAWSVGELSLPLGAAFRDALPWAPGLSSSLVVLLSLPLLAVLLALLLPRSAAPGPATGTGTELARPR
jgi:FSR family fosmidomycin resistance protein-like MFS transporter